MSIEKTTVKETGGVTARDVLTVLQRATKGLLFPSESDTPVKAFLWEKSEGADTGGAVDEAALRAAGKVSEGATVETVTVETFFDPVVTAESWWGAAEKATATRFQELIAVLRNTLTGIAAFRVRGAGEDNSIIVGYVVGRTAAGDLAGVFTQFIET